MVLTIGLLWHSASSDNLGVGALTMSQLNIIDSVAEKLKIKIHYHIIGTFGGQYYISNGNDIVGVHCLTLKRLLMFKSNLSIIVKKCDIVFDIGEGDSFTDIYGYKRFILQVVSKMIVLLQKKPLILSPQTIGPFDSSFTRFLSKVVMKRAKRVYARDGLSLEYLQNNGIMENAEEAIDVAFRLPYDREVKSTIPGKIKIGLNVSGLLYNGSYKSNNMFGLSVDYAELSHNILTSFSKLKDTQIYLISHVISDVNLIEDDYTISDKLHRQFPNTILVDKFTSPSDAKSFISTMDFFVGARMHACIAAFSSGVPVVPLSYSRKFNGLFSSLGYNYLGDCKNSTNEELLNLVLCSFANRDILRRDVESGNLLALDKLSNYEKFVEQVLVETYAKKTVNS